MKPLHWDCLTISERYKVLSLWDFNDIAPRSKLVECVWEDLPLEVKTILKLTR